MAQRIEQQTSNLSVVGSIPTGRAMFHYYMHYEPQCFAATCVVLRNVLEVAVLRRGHYDF